MEVPTTTACQSLLEFGLWDRRQDEITRRVRPTNVLTNKRVKETVMKETVGFVRRNPVVWLGC